MSSAFLFNVEEHKEEREKFWGCYIWQVDVKTLAACISGRQRQRFYCATEFIFLEIRN